MYDVIVIGARCAGAPTAMLLARKGYRVLLVDRATFPADIPHGHFIHRHGPRRLRRWGLLDRVLATAPAVTTVTFDLGDFPLTADELAVDGVPFGCGPRRTLLDQILVDAAVEAGAELREGFTVEEFTAVGDAITGIRGRSGLSPVMERATVTVGADGRNSRLARTVRAPEYESVPPLAVWYFSYWSGVPDRGLEVYARQGRAIFAFPTSGGGFGLFVGWPAAEFPRVRGDVEGAFMAVIDGEPELAELVRGGRREERFRGATDLPNFLRKPYGPGWALVGDAGCHKDPFMALGICDAFRDAELLAGALDDGLCGRRPLDQALAEYERLRNADTMDLYRENLGAARLAGFPPQALALRAGLRGDREATRQWMMAREGMLGIEGGFGYLPRDHPARPPG